MGTAFWALAGTALPNCSATISRYAHYRIYCSQCGREVCSQPDDQYHVSLWYVPHTCLRQRADEFLMLTHQFERFLLHDCLPLIFLVRIKVSQRTPPDAGGDGGPMTECELERLP